MFKVLKTEKNALKMYQDLQSLDWELSEYFNDCYDENFNTRIATSAFIELIINSKTTRKSIDDKKLIEKAKSIIANNMKQNVNMSKSKDDQIKEQEDALDEQTEILRQIYEQGRDEYLDLEDRVKDALIGER